MKQIYLIRHAQSAANAGKTSDTVTHTNAKIPITELGQQQAEQLSIWLRQNIENVHEIFVSPYLRTQQTAAPYVQAIHMQPTILPNLHEFNYLSFANIQGKTFQDVKTQSEHYWALNDVDFRDGDDCDSFASFFQQISDVRRYFSAKDDGVYVVFGHGFWIGVLLWQLIGRYADSLNMTKFREFELLVRPKNTDVYLWQMDNQIESIAKVRNANDDV
ncbi:histidine phosphatase family protein [Alysiella filiformis]|uniref:Broad specificity phosphatase PhoE n=1 Tax=Alysiella filiformis DSM 16848 TaxID=1120981 RepID=A0A286ECG1_9NEIS|nr:histidine phosphatase family protein [Alysiella filiformis]QMT30578.1 histidine phosphatase family protein [Alysiella filiformis]UBQ56443.1 histidine phosphatase family protein [Alysiella filiformis DSM 16848]SOD68569.1 Broad specificity phosphatase PhoE [Alysiella filiformis DSM 16848]